MLKTLLFLYVTVLLFFINLSLSAIFSKTISYSSPCLETFLVRLHPPILQCEQPLYEYCEQKSTKTNQNTKAPLDINKSGSTTRILVPAELPNDAFDFWKAIKQTSEGADVLLDDSCSLSKLLWASNFCIWLPICEILEFLSYKVCMRTDGNLCMQYNQAVLTLLQLHLMYPTLV